MKKIVSTGALTVLLSFAGATMPALADADEIVIEGAWARASIGMNRPGAAYMTIYNTGAEAVTLTGLSTPLAMMPAIHETRTSAEGVSSMAPTDEITIAPGESVALEPGGLHVMLLQLQEPMVEGETFPLTLIFEDGGEATVDVSILAFAARGPEG